MIKVVSFIVILLTCVGLSGCTEALEDSMRGPDSNVENIHVYVDGWTGDDTLCQTAMFLKGNEMYSCTFTLNDDSYIVVDLEIAHDSDNVDLITLDNINYEKWQDGESYYSLEDWTDYETYGGEYGKDLLMPEGEWIVVIFNPPSEE
jgi:hypothetical protein|tara:strand:- start:1577 stop:2017 length:441 start_codon:yes stop_codon:yes gene_type:complete